MDIRTLMYHIRNHAHNSLNDTGFNQKVNRERALVRIRDIATKAIKISGEKGISVEVLKALALHWIANAVENKTAHNKDFKDEISNLGIDYSLFLTHDEIAFVETEIYTFIDDTRDSAFINDSRDKVK